MGVILSLLVYFIPSIIVFYKKASNKWKVFAINFLLGWTLIGWIIALIMAVKSKKSEEKAAVDGIALSGNLSSQPMYSVNNFSPAETSLTTWTEEVTHKASSSDKENYRQTKHAVDHVLPEDQSEIGLNVEIMPQTLQGIPRAYHYENVNIAIIKERKPDFNRLKPGMAVSFIPEPSNPYDPKAVIVQAEDTNIGYLHKGNLQEMTLDYLKRDDPIKAFITIVDESNVNVKISIGFYKEKESDYSKLMRRRAPFKTFKLTGNRNEDMQETLLYCSEGEEVEYEYDFDKEKYSAICGNYIGYFPKSAEKYLEDDNPAFIEDLEEDENDKYVVRVAVFLKSE